MRLFSPGETFPPARFGISGATGAATNADATPTLAVYRNGVLDGAVSVTVLNPATGEYSFTFVIPGGYALGDVVSVRATATVAGIVLAPQELVSFRLDNKVGTRAVAGDAMALTAGERTTLYTGVWDNASRTLTAISDSAGVTTLLTRLTSTRAAYLDALTALTEGRMVWLERLGTALEETSVGSGLWRWTTLALSRLGIDVSAIKAKTDALPLQPAAVGSAMTLANNSVTAAALATDAVEEIAGAISTTGATRLLAMPLQSGRTEAVRYTRGAEGPDLLDHVLDGNGSRIDITGYTITASLIRVGTEASVFTNAAAALGNAPEEGQVILDWPANSLDTPGQYRLIWTATKAGADTLTWQTLVVVE